MDGSHSINHVLVIDDEPDLCELLEITLARMNVTATSANTMKDGLTLMAQGTFDLCLTDMRLPDGNGLEIVQHIEEHHPELPVAVITAHGNIEDAVKALRSGAYDFVSKPVDLKLLRKLIASALELPRQRQQPPAQVEQESRLLGNSESVRNLRKLILKLSRSQAPVYVRGESGVGKELVAREIHKNGSRTKGPFIAVNCGAIPSELMESEFFGHKKGSFTGAVADKQGLFAAAEGGTLFLDEVADLPINMQVKLLRVIQERAVKAVGDSQELPIDVRILSATHKNLADEVAQQRFRQDLFYRLNVIELNVPSLRERPQDIPLLAEHFLRQISSEWQSDLKSLSEAAIEKLKAYPFPGNVRELENVLERAMTFAEGKQIEAEDLAITSQNGNSNANTDSDGLLDELESKERDAIVSALESTHWNKTAAARKLGMTLRQLRYRLKKYYVD